MSERKSMNGADAMVLRWVDSLKNEALRLCNLAYERGVGMHGIGGVAHQLDASRIERMADKLRRDLEGLVAEKEGYRLELEVARKVLAEQGIRLLACGDGDFRCGNCERCAT